MCISEGGDFFQLRSVLRTWKRDFIIRTITWWPFICAHLKQAIQMNQFLYLWWNRASESMAERCCCCYGDLYVYTCFQVLPTEGSRWGVSASASLSHLQYVVSTDFGYRLWTSIPIKWSTHRRYSLHHRQQPVSLPLSNFHCLFLSTSTVWLLCVECSQLFCWPSIVLTSSSVHCKATCLYRAYACIHMNARLADLILLMIY